MARAAVGWSLDELAAASGVSRRMILRYENGETIQPEKVQAMRKALQAKGVQFIDGGPLAGAVRLAS